ncbi:MAG: class F sortase [Acidimicrobiales bacterium]
MERVWWAVSAVLLVVAVVALYIAWPTADPKSVVLSSAPPRSSTRPSTDAVPRRTPAPARSVPMRLSVPNIGINIAVGRLGLDANGQVMVPATAHTVGWYVHGPTPGQIGSAVILGHVDSYLGPGVFFYLRNLVAGDSIQVTLADGSVVSFRVNRVEQYSKSAFPDRLVYGSHGTRSLQLVTCGGTFDHATGSYESNIVVFSTFVSMTAPRQVRS